MKFAILAAGSIAHNMAQAVSGIEEAEKYAAEKRIKEIGGKFSRL